MDKYYPKIVDNQLDQLGRLWKVTKEDLNNTNIISILGDVSHYRGGDSSVGSIIWRDVRELISKRFGYQTFGHTMISKPIVINNWSCLDCKRIFILDNESNLCNLDDIKLEIYGE